MDVVGIGALNIDELFLVDELIEDDEVVIKEEFICCGGSAANTIYALAKLGLECGFIGVVGDDPYRELIVNDLSSVGVDISRVRKKSGKRCGRALCFVDRQGRRSIYILGGANYYLSEEDIDFDYINKAKILHMSSLKGRLPLQAYIIENLKKSNSTIIISFAPGAVLAREGLYKLKNILKKIDILFLNKKELSLLIKDSSMTLKDKLFKLLVVEGIGKIVVLTQGEEGAIVMTKDECIEKKPEKVGVVVDTTGAGDAYAAGFLYGYIKGHDLFSCAHIGSILASYCIQALGARKNLPDKLDLRFDNELLH